MRYTNLQLSYFLNTLRLEKSPTLSFAVTANLFIYLMFVHQ